MSIKYVHDYGPNIICMHKKIKEAQMRGMRFELQSTDEIFLRCHFDTKEKHLTDSDKKDINELMSNLFKSDKGPNSNLVYNLTTANREYENYCEEREYLKERMERDNLIFRVKIIEPLEEIEPFLNYEGFRSGNSTTNAKPESYEVESYNVANNRALLNVLHEKDHVYPPRSCVCNYRATRRFSEHDCPWEAPFRVIFNFFDEWVDSFWP